MTKKAKTIGFVRPKREREREGEGGACEREKEREVWIEFPFFATT